MWEEKGAEVLTKRQPTTKDVGLLHQLFEDGQLDLAPEFQRNSVWPRPAKAYLIDTILKDRPIPLIFLQRYTSAQSGRPAYSVIDGQQRLRAIFEFIDGRFRLSQSDESDPYYRLKFDELERHDQDQILNYDLVVQELHGYSQADIRDAFIRINKYVVKLSPQELRHAKREGSFARLAERIGKWTVWKEQKVITPTQMKRMRAVEFSAELIILLVEGPQDKKAVVDLYYVQYRNKFPYAKRSESALRTYVDWIISALPTLSKSRFRKPVDFYALVGALDEIVEGGRRLSSISKEKAGKALEDFERQTRSKRPSKSASRYIAAASRQTDNILPRSTRIEVLREVILGSKVRN